MVMTRKDWRREELTKESFELTELAKEFELYNRTEGKSPKTVDWYNLSLKQFHRFLVQSEQPARLANLGEHQVREFILYLQEKTRWQDNPHIPEQKQKLASISIQTYIRALRAFFNWLYKEGYTPENRLANLKPPKAQQKLVKILSEDEIKSMFSCLDVNTAAGCRDYAILLVLLDTGIRCSELTNLKLDDVDIDAGNLKVMGKGGKERIVPFGIIVQRSLLRYVSHFRVAPLLPGTNNFFLTLDGLPLTRNSMKMLFQRIASKCGVKRLHPHLCRHTFATNYLINGGDVFTLQQILGHTSLEMVRRYVSLASAHVIVQHRKFSPMDRINVAHVRAWRQDRSVKKDSSIFLIPTSERL
jgi:integrase/recombinase XerC/integrase/recombinase XerD